MGMVAKMKKEGKRPRRRNMIAWEEWATDTEKWKGLCKTSYPAQGEGGER